MENISTNNTDQSFERRKFITTTLKAACASTLLNVPAIINAAGYREDDLTIQNVIDII